MAVFAVQLMAVAISVCLLPWSNAQAISFTRNIYYKTEPETFIEGGFHRPESGFIEVECTGDNLVNVSYSIVEADPGPFAIDHETGAISVTTDLDYENESFYQFHVRCVDIDNPSRMSTATVQIEVSSVNEFLPEVNPRQVLLAVREDLAPGTVIATVFPDESGMKVYMVTDQDDWPHGTTSTRYTISEDSSADAAQFTLEPTSGTLRMTGSLDIDDIGIHTATIRIIVCDDETQAHLCPTFVVNIPLLPVNDNDPQFSKEVYEGTVPVSQIVDSPIDFGISCTDLDKEEGELEGYELVSPSSTWNIDSRDGTLSIKQPLNSLRSTFDLRCFDTDGREDTASVIINVNYHPKLNQSVYNFTLQQGVTPPVGGLSVGNISAVDINGDILTFSIEGSNHFVINSETGEVRLLDIVSTSEGNVFELRVYVSDGSLTDSATVQVLFRVKDDGDGTTSLSRHGLSLAVILFFSVLFAYLFPQHIV